MSQPLSRLSGSLPRLILSCLFTVALVQPGPSSNAQVSAPVRFIIGTFSVGGYFLTSGSAHAALGSSKFYGSSSFFTRPRHYRGFDLTGGLQYTSAGDHFFPFGGGDTFELVGPAFELTTRHVDGRLRPYVTGGLFLGHVKSEQERFDKAAFTPSMGFGVEFPCARYLTLYTGYRVSTAINGVNTDGFSLGFRFF